jgi:predicted pyridoxine 5'-phosphate oxidase superfamily flavin-nucleotide-binding protein
MKLTEKQIDLLKRRKIVVLATSSLEGEPQAILVEVNQVKDDKIIITDNEMETTRKNLLENNKVALLAFEEDYSYCLKILGEAEYCIKGEYFDFVKNLETNKRRSPKGAVVITVKEVIEFK